MRFTKMHGLGNDYVYVNCVDGSLGGDDNSFLADDERLARLAITLSDRHTGIGGDGVILILPSRIADFRMRMFNADGSEGKMCGNGVRCIGKYVYDNGLTNNLNVALETLSGVKYLQLSLGPDGKVAEATVDMGAPELRPEAVPVIIPAGHQGNMDIPLEAGGKGYHLSAVSMGNPHGVVFVDSLAGMDVHGVGALLENHPAFPDRANIEFVEQTGPEELTMRVWERGSGETMACGTGACAVAVAAMLSGRVPRNAAVKVRLLGGDLIIRWDEVSGHVFMQGPATEVFSGSVTL